MKTTTTTTDPQQDPAAPRSSETIAILDFTTPPGASRSSDAIALLDFATPSGLTRAVIPSASNSGLHRPIAVTTPAFRPNPARPRNGGAGPSHHTSPGVFNRRRVILRATIVAVLLAALGWGVVEVRKLTSAPRHARRDSAPTVITAAAPAPDPTASAAPDDTFLDDFVDDASMPGESAQTFLRTHVKRDGELAGPAIQLAGSGAGAPIASQAVTVVNFWATWCAPCKAEFSGFQSMFVLNRRDQMWGNETRFVPILVDDLENARTAYRDWKTAMPDIHAALIDQKLDHNGVRGAVQKIEALHAGPDFALPVTLLFDCRRKIRWFKIGALDQAAFNALADQIDELRAELHQDKCKPKRTASAPSTPPPLQPQVPTTAVPTLRSTCNNDGRCDVRREDCDLCPGDCPCAGGLECKPRSTGGHFCKESI
jgi:thiol-disulfide isomerase/thioredoxin